MSAERRFSRRGQTAYPPVTDKLRATVVKRILDIGTPLKIVLFGSRARGMPGQSATLTC